MSLCDHGLPYPLLRATPGNQCGRAWTSLQPVPYRLHVDTLVSSLRQWHPRVLLPLVLGGHPTVYPLNGPLTLLPMASFYCRVAIYLALF